MFDWVDVNAKIAIAFSLTMVAFLLLLILGKMTGTIEFPERKSPKLHKS